MAASKQPSLEQLVACALQLQRDEDLDLAELRRRDREIGRTLAGDQRSRVLAWLDRVGEGASPSVGERAGQAQRWLAALLVALGLLLGWAAARVVYHYDGSRPVNVVEVLAVFVALQWVLLAVTGVAASPGLAGIRGFLGPLSPGRWQAGLARLLPQPQREAFTLALGRSRGHQRLFSRVQKWVVLLGSQAFAVAFHLGALFSASYLVLFTDLAFGWSTTLQVDAADLYHLTQLLAAPWARVAPEAVPSLPLIDATRYFRLGGGVLPNAPSAPALDPAALGGWWQFCVACMVAYGALPRIVTWAIARRRLAAAVTEAFDRLPGLAELCDRLDHPLVETSGEGSEPAVHSVAAAAGPAVPASSVRRSLVVNWSGVAMADTALQREIEQALALPVLSVRRAGAGCSLDDDREVVRAIAEAGTDGDLAVVVAVRSWEPPILEFIDFAAELRAKLGDGVSIVVVPVAVDSLGGVEAPNPSHVEQWRLRLAAAGDPWMSVRPLEPAALA
jgi:hypothetical protein